MRRIPRPTTPVTPEPPRPRGQERGRARRLLHFEATMDKMDLLRHTGLKLQHAIDNLDEQPLQVGEMVVAICEFDHEAKQLFGSGGAQVRVGEVGRCIASTADQRDGHDPFHEYNPLIEWRTEDNVTRTFTGVCNMPKSLMVRLGHWQLILDHMALLLRKEVGIQEVKLTYTT